MCNEPNDFIGPTSWSLGNGSGHTACASTTAEDKRGFLTRAAIYSRHLMGAPALC